MSKVTLNQAFERFQGKIGDIVFKKINGKVFASLRAESDKPRTEKQRAWNQKFKHASNFAQCVKNDPELLAFYAPIAKARGCRMREVVLSDAFQGPKIESVDLSQYSGQPGSMITVCATDNIGVASVQIWIFGANEVYESGLAVPAGETWRYTATLAMPAGGPVRIEVLAKDRPGNSATEKLTWPPGAAPAAATAAP